MPERSILGCSAPTSAVPFTPRPPPYPPHRHGHQAPRSTRVFLKPITGKSVLSTKEIITNLWPPPHPPTPPHQLNPRGGAQPMPGPPGRGQRVPYLQDCGDVR